MGQPSLIVFDLDFTLWDCGGLWVDCVSYPFRSLPTGAILDRSGRKMHLYEDVLEILDEVEEMAIPTALASRTEQPNWARDLLDRMKIRQRFEYEQIYPGSKVQHFSELTQVSGIPYSEMLFFDDEHRNIQEVGELGVTCIEVVAGLSRDCFAKGMRRFAERSPQG